QTENAPETFVYPLSDLQNPEVLKDFTENFQKWKSDNSIF
ncbi:MAG: class I SAM-dependent methyltransferase, partial [Streptococcus salivarius]